MGRDWCIVAPGQGIMAKEYKKVVKFLNDNKVDETKALKTLNIYNKNKNTAHTIRVKSWAGICADTLRILKQVPKYKNIPDRQIILKYVKSKDYVWLRKMFRKKNNPNENPMKLARNFQDMVNKHKKNPFA